MDGALPLSHFFVFFFCGIAVGRMDGLGLDHSGMGILVKAGTEKLMSIAFGV